MNREYDRPSPDALLHEVGNSARGRLKIFLGASPGVGKTYEMLSEARERQAQGLDVVIGIVETHGRDETRRLTEGLPALPRRRMTYQGRAFDELDIDAVLERRSALVLVDELAHTNIPGSRHEKRYQDVEEILAAGIDVYTTLNVQHVESLNDVINQITRVKVQETLPDSVIEKADEIELIDLPPDDLIQRLHEGKVYVPEQAKRATQHFFGRGNLTALRELAMRVAADRVDADVLGYRQARAIVEPWATRERLMVLIGDSRDAERLVRLGKRLAERHESTWIVAHVMRGESETHLEKGRLQSALELAERLGGETVSLTGFDLVEEILAFSRERNVTQIVVGRSRRRLRWLTFRTSLASALLRHASNIEITIAGCGDVQPQEESASVAIEIARSEIPFLLPLGTTGLAAGLAWLLSQVLTTANLSLVFLVGVLFVAVRSGLRASIVTAVTSFLVFNFLFTEPRYTFDVTQREDLLTLLFFLLVATVTGNLAARVRKQMDVLRANQRRNSLLFEFSRRIAGAVGRDDLAWSVCEYVGQSLGAETIVLLADSDKLAVAAGDAGTHGLIEVERAAADWAFERRDAAGRGTGTLPNCRWYFLPLGVSGKKACGVLGVTYADRKRMMSGDQRRLLVAMRDQAAVAFERAMLVEERERAELRSETEKLRSALLSSVSHDLRTPLVSIIGATTTLLDADVKLGGEQRRELTEQVLSEAERLNRFVQNLLDMTRLGYGALKPRLEWVDLRDVVADARQRLRDALRRHPVQVQIEPGSEMLFTDAVLLGQVIANLLDNAAKYSPPDAVIQLRVQHRGRDHVIEIEDDGAGIPRAEREYVFDMFYRVRAGDQQVAGTGLGLPICRGLVESLGGTIHAVNPRDGKGACLRLQFPWRRPEPVNLEDES